MRLTLLAIALAISACTAAPPAGSGHPFGQTPGIWADEFPGNGPVSENFD